MTVYTDDVGIDVVTHLLLLLMTDDIYGDGDGDIGQVTSIGCCCYYRDVMMIHSCTFALFASC